MKEGITFVGIDAHKEQLVVAVLAPGRQEAVVSKIPNTEREVRKLGRKLLKHAAGEVRACYEAGPLGYGLKRQLEKQDIVCEVIAPSLIPSKPGDRVKTDSRDAVKLAQLLKAGLLTEVVAPTPDEEAVRDLCRLRLRVREDLTRARNQAGKFLLRRGCVFRAASTWTQAHRRWLHGLKLSCDADQVILAEYLRALEQLEDRVKALDEHIASFAAREEYAERVGWLRCFRGIETLTAMVIITELHRIERFESARSLMSYLGLTVSEHSSGDRTKRGGITKAGNVYVRRILVESAQHCRKEPSVSRKLRDRRKNQPADVIAIADRAQHRLHRRYWRLVQAGKETNKAKVACARELVGFIWGVLYPRAEAVRRAAA